LKIAAGLLLIFAMLFGFSVRSVDALSCASPRPPMEELGYSQLVFKGKVVSQTNSTLKFAVSKAWKGDVTEKVTLYQNGWTEFRNGEEYIVFAGNEDGGKMRPKLCGNTGLAAKFDERALGESISLKPSTSYTVQIIVGFAAVVLLAVIVGLAIARRRY